MEIGGKKKLPASCGRRNNWPMDWVRRMLGGWLARRQAKIRRVMVLRLEGLDPGQVDKYLDEGLLHSLALLADIGTPVPLSAVAAPFDLPDTSRAFWATVR